MTNIYRMSTTTKYSELLKYSNPEKVSRNLHKYLGNTVKLYMSTRKSKKYMIQDTQGRWVHFGGFNPPMEDFTKHGDQERRRRYLQRATNIRGDWEDNPYSSNMLSIRLLWN